MTAAQTDEQGRQLSDDGNYWWDGSQWQLVDRGNDAAAPPAVAPFHPAVDGEFDPAVHGEYDKAKHGDFHPEIHGTFDPARHGKYDKAKHGDFHPLAHGDYDAAVHGEFDPAVHGDYHPQIHGEFHQNRHGPHDAARHGPHDPSMHGTLSVERHGAAAVAAAQQAPAQQARTDGAAAATPQVQHDQPPAPGPVALVDTSGQVVAHGHATHVHRAGTVAPASHALQLAIEGGIAGLSAIPGIGQVVQLLEAAHSLGCTIAVGVNAEVAAFVGFAQGAGLYYTPSGEIGEYESLGEDVGGVVGVSASDALTVVYGGADALKGDCLAVTLGVEAASGSLLFTPEGHFCGIACSASLGVGEPFALYQQHSHTQIRPLT